MHNLIMVESCTVRGDRVMCFRTTLSSPLGLRTSGFHARSQVRTFILKVKLHDQVSTPRICIALEYSNKPSATQKITTVNTNPVKPIISMPAENPKL